MYYSHRDGSAIDENRKMSAIIIHGTADYIRPYDGKEGKWGLLSAESAVAYWRIHNGLPETPFSSVSEGAVDYTGFREASEDEDCPTRVDFYKVNNGGHVWLDFPFGDSKTTADTVLAFFAQCKLAVSSSS